MKGWGEFGWTFISKAERVCRECEQPIKRQDDVGEVRTVHRTNKQDLLCKDCQRARSEALIADTRSRLTP